MSVDIIFSAKIQSNFFEGYTTTLTRRFIVQLQFFIEFLFLHYGNMSCEVFHRRDTKLDIFINILKWNNCILLRDKEWQKCQKCKNLTFKVNFLCLVFFLLSNIIFGAKIQQSAISFKKLHFLRWYSNFDNSTLHQLTKYNDLRRVCWFLIKNISSALSMLSLLCWYQIWPQIMFKREEESQASSLSNVICCQNWYQRKSD